MGAKRTTKPTDNRPPIAISYLRFSTPEQRKGDSMRRQTEGTETWCEKNGIPLDRELSCLDAGRSAYHGKHREDKAALGKFLELVKAGRVPHGSFLVIENLDRLSREDERTALRLWLDILDAGVNIVQLNPETVFREDRSDMTDIIRAIIELSRGHSESRMKSARSASNWEAALRLAREGKNMTPRRKDGRVTKLLTARLPAWVEEKDGRPQLMPERAEVVRRIFELATAGYGMTSIVKRLKEVSAFGGRVPDEDGHHRKADGQPFGCGEWRTSYVRSILKDRRALGEYQPRDANERPKGDPIPDYYPRVVSDAEFFAARAAVAGRKTKQGRIGNGVTNLFGGLLRNARDGQTYYAATLSDKYGTRRILLNKTSREGQSRCYTFPYAVFERAILSQLRELDPAEVLGGAVLAAEPSVLRGELEWVREKRAALEAELLKGDLAAIAAALRQLHDREAELKAQLGDAEERTAKPMEETWRDAKSLVGMLDNATEEEREDLRLRLRAALRRIVDEVWIIVVPRGRDRLLEATVRFANGGYRNYLIASRSARGNQRKVDPGRWFVRSIKHPDDGLPLSRGELSDLDQADIVRGHLEAYPADTLDYLLRQGHVAP